MGGGGGGGAPRANASAVEASLCAPIVCSGFLKPLLALPDALFNALVPHFFQSIVALIVVESADARFLVRDIISRAVAASNLGAGVNAATSSS